MASLFPFRLCALLVRMLTITELENIKFQNYLSFPLYRVHLLLITHTITYTSFIPYALKSRHCKFSVA